MLRPTFALATALFVTTAFWGKPIHCCRRARPERRLCSTVSRVKIRLLNRFKALTSSQHA